jgi:hypothetical protein
MVPTMKRQPGCGHLKQQPPEPRRAQQPPAAADRPPVIVVDPGFLVVFERYVSIPK